MRFVIGSTTWERFSTRFKAGAGFLVWFAANAQGHGIMAHG
jgi:hypothetical protein